MSRVLKIFRCWPRLFGMKFPTTTQGLSVVGLITPHEVRPEGIGFGRSPQRVATEDVYA